MWFKQYKKIHGKSSKLCQQKMLSPMHFALSEDNIKKRQNAQNILTTADMEKGVDTRTLSAEIFENCGNFWIVED